MNTKLTLSLNKEIIEKAKVYAKKNRTSLSFLVENYLQKVIADYKNDTFSKGNIVDELSGIIKLDADSNYRDNHSDYLLNKYK